MNKQCLLCNNSILNSISLEFILSLKKQQVDYICKKCQRQFILITHDDFCNYCGRLGKFKLNTCGDCNQWNQKGWSWFTCRSIYSYNDFMSTYMKKYKFNGDYYLRKVFSKQFFDKLNHKECLVPIPISKNTMYKRRFNQVHGLMENLKFQDVLLVDKQKNTQSHHNKKQRMAMQQIFSIDDRYMHLIVGKNVTIVDDVYTTGTTIRLAAAILKENGAKSVSGFTLAR